MYPAPENLLDADIHTAINLAPTLLLTDELNAETLLGT
jgi:hypothetical protein